MKRSVISIWICLLAAAPAARPADWPAHMRDAWRSGVTAERVALPAAEIWRFRGPRPAPAWDDPAQRDFWHYAENLKPRVAFDRTHHTVAAYGLVFFGSAADGCVYALDAETGALRWRFAAGGPVRLPPSLWDGRVYAGSDGGSVYCLDARTGEAVWTFNAAAGPRLIPGNGRLISPWPVRTGVLVDDGVARFAAGLFPDETVNLFALDARTGETVWKRAIDYSPQGHMLASGSHLYVPTGRATPAVFDKRTGDFIRILEGFGGAYALIEGETVTHGPGRAGELGVSAPGAEGQLATFAGNHMIVTPKASYLHTDTELMAIDRERHIQLQRERARLAGERDQLAAEIRKSRNAGPENPGLQDRLRAMQIRMGEVERGLGQCVLWRVECGHPLSLILAGGHLFAGGDGSVGAYSAADGARVWSAQTEGKAFGLAAAEGRLLVSTDRGVIHAFEHTPIPSPLAEHAAQTEPLPPAGGEIAALMDRIETHTGESVPRKGYALLAGVDESLLIGALRSAEWKLAVAESNAGAAAHLREMLLRHGMNGTRAAVFERNPAELSAADSIFNLTLIGRECAADLDANGLAGVLRMVRPHGGVAGFEIPAGGSPFRRRFETRVRQAGIAGEVWIDQAAGWAFIARGPLPGEGSWTHLYADLGNTASSGDALVSHETRVQWFGRPGARPMIDRHHRPPSPLAANGRLFIPGDERVFCLDAYNGTVLWEAAAPGSRRVGIPYDAGNMALDEKTLWIASGETCLGIGVETGQSAARWKTPAMGDNPLSYHWGYIASAGDVLLGTLCRPGAARSDLSREDIVEQYGEFRPVTVAEGIFAMDKATGKPRWMYRGGRIVNTAVCADESSVYFVERDDPGGLFAQGRAPLRELLARDVFLTALDLGTGEIRWRKPVDLRHCQHILYLSLKDSVLVATGSYNNGEAESVWYEVTAFRASDGGELWRRQHENNRKGLGGDHGEQVHHPVILDGMVIAEPAAYRLETGEPVSFPNADASWSLAARSGCGTLSGSLSCLFFRDGFPQALDLRAGGPPAPVGGVGRPGCWINMIPAGGLLLIPEASSGCTCNYPIQSSMAFAPRR